MINEICLKCRFVFVLYLEKRKFNELEDKLERLQTERTATSLGLALTTEQLDTIKSGMYLQIPYILQGHPYKTVISINTEKVKIIFSA